MWNIMCYHMCKITVFCLIEVIESYLTRNNDLLEEFSALTNWHCFYELPVWTNINKCFKVNGNKFIGSVWSVKTIYQWVQSNWSTPTILYKTFLTARIEVIWQILFLFVLWLSCSLVFGYVSPGTNVSSIRFFSCQHFDLEGKSRKMKRT